ncbi:MAG TPA: PaaI family thioesterase [Candidatus Methylomirabilis sp.]|nr:PaaI family thioesterase [Candidatus Methylomirabilis sp.]
MTSESARRVEAARARFVRTPFVGWLGVTVADVSQDRAVLVLPHQPDHMNAVGVLNGGASASLLTMAGTLAAWTGVDLDADLQLGCVDVSIQYLSPVTDEDVVAEACVLRRGRTLIFVDVALSSRRGVPICQGLLSYQASDYAGQQPRVQAMHALLPAPTPLIPPMSPRLFRGYVRKLGITALHESAGRVRLHMPCTGMHVDDGGRLHAGALASIADIAAVAASWSLVPRRPGARGSTIGMQVSYPYGAAADVVADAHIQQRSEELLFSTVQITTAASGQLVAMGQVSYRLREPWP